MIIQATATPSQKIATAQSFNNVLVLFQKTVITERYAVIASDSNSIRAKYRHGSIERDACLGLIQAGTKPTAIIIGQVTADIANEMTALDKTIRDAGYSFYAIISLFEDVSDDRKLSDWVADKRHLIFSSYSNDYLDLQKNYFVNNVANDKNIFYLLTKNKQKSFSTKEGSVANNIATFKVEGFRSVSISAGAISLGVATFTYDGTLVPAVNQLLHIENTPAGYSGIKGVYRIASVNSTTKKITFDIPDGFTIPSNPNPNPIPSIFNKVEKNKSLYIDNTPDGYANIEGVYTIKTADSATGKITFDVLDNFTITSNSNPISCVLNFKPQLSKIAGATASLFPGQGRLINRAISGLENEILFADEIAEVKARSTAYISQVRGITSLLSSEESGGKFLDKNQFYDEKIVRDYIQENCESLATTYFLNNSNLDLNVNDIGDMFLSIENFLTTLIGNRVIQDGSNNTGIGAKYLIQIPEVTQAMKDSRQLKGVNIVFQYRNQIQSVIFNIDARR